MKRMATAAAGFLLATSAWAGVTKEDLRKLVTAGVGDEVILAFVRANGPLDRLSADDLVDLKKAGASDKLLEAVMVPAVKEQAPVYRDAAVTVPNLRVEVPRTETVYVQRPTTVYVDTPTYTTYPSWYYTGTWPSRSYSYGYYPSTWAYHGSHHRRHHHSQRSWSVGWCW